MRSTTEQGRSRRHLVHAGKEFTFGDCTNCAHDVTTPGAHGVIAAHDGYYTVTNTRRPAPISIWSVLNRGHTFSIEPGETAAVPFSDATIAGTSGPVLMVHTTAVTSRHPICQTPATAPVASGSRDYAIIYVLCEPLLADPHARTTSIPDIAARLGLSQRAVHHALDRLINRLAIPVPVDTPTGWRTTAIATHALDNGLLTEPPDWPRRRAAS